MGVGFKGAIAATVLVIGIAGAQPPAEAVKISGHVEDRLPEPLANITVLLRLGESGNEVSKTQTDNAGRFEFAAVPPNSYEVVLQVPGFKSRTVPVSATKIAVDVVPLFWMSPHSKIRSRSPSQALALHRRRTPTAPS